MARVTTVNVDESNVEQARAWDGEEGAYWAENAVHFDRAVAAYHAPFMRAAAIGAGEHVLDVGCGAGETTRAAGHAAVGGSALGVDLSERLLAYARDAAAAEGLTNVTFAHADAQIHPFAPGGFDVAISRTGAMFFGDQVAAFANIAKALQPHGRLALLTWQGPGPNEWLRELSGALAAGRDLPVPPLDAPGPFALSDPDRVTAILSAAGFDHIELDGRVAPMWFGNDEEDAHRFVLGLLGWMLQGLDDRRRQQALDDLRANVARHATADGVVYGSATWTITARRSA